MGVMFISYGNVKIKIRVIHQTKEIEFQTMGINIQESVFDLIWFHQDLNFDSTLLN